jgi:hypothetical protein
METAPESLSGVVKRTKGSSNSSADACFPACITVPIEIKSQHCAFYSDPQRIPAGSIEFDCGLLMRGLPHEWHQLTDIPEMAVNAR